MPTIGQYAVHVHDDAGELHSFLPGADVPGWAAKLMGKHCFEGGEGEFNEDGKHAPVVHADAVVDTQGGGGPPPRAGKGSGEDKWRAYADEQGVDVSEAQGRDDIIAELDEAGVPVE